MENAAQKPTAQQRLIAELEAQRNQALNAFAQTGAELGATREALQEAEVKIAELQKQVEALKMKPPEVRELRDRDHPNSELRDALAK